MKKIMTIAALAALSLTLVSGAALAMDAKELIAKSQEATGGLDLSLNTKTITARGKAMAQGMEFPFVMYQARPNQMRLEVEVMGMQMIQAYDGEKGWTINPMMGITEAQEMGEMENKSFKLQSDMDGVLVDYEKKGYTVEYIGEADVEGTPCYQLRVDTKMDIVQDIFFDQEYFLPIKTTSTVQFEGKEIVQDTYMSDFQELEDGRVVPFSIETRMGDVTANQIVIETMAFDDDLSAIEFAMPAAEEEAAGE